MNGGGEEVLAHCLEPRDLYVVKLEIKFNFALMGFRKNKCQDLL